MKYIKPSIKLNDYIIDERIAAYEGVSLFLDGFDSDDFAGKDNEPW